MGDRSRASLLSRGANISRHEFRGRSHFANAAITICGIELAHRIRKGQFSFGRGRRRYGWSRREEWAMALAWKRGAKHSFSLRAALDDLKSHDREQKVKAYCLP